MNFSNEESDCRVDIFKPSGKWHATITLKLPNYTGKDLLHEFKKQYRKRFAGWYSGMTAVCLEPYHEHSHPLMITI